MWFSGLLIAAAIVQALPAPSVESSNVLNEYLIVPKDSSTVAAMRFGSGLREEYKIGNFKAYYGNFDEKTVDEIRKNPNVAFVEPNRIFRADITVEEQPSKVRRALVTQSPASYGLARISHRQNGAGNYIYDSSAGEGVYVYVIATGIYTSHTEFGGRAVWGHNTVDSINTDGNGIGTAVAGIIAGSTNGVAKRATVIAVKVLGADGSGSTSSVISGTTWSVDDIVSKGRIGKAIIVMPIGGSYSAVLNNAVNSASAQGVPVFVPAGSSGTDAANTSPASASTAIVIGGISSTDARASFSNYGAVLDFFAPAISITVPWISLPTSYNTISGTTVSTAYGAGVGAYLLGMGEKGNLVDKMNTLATKGAITNLPAGTKNQIVYNGSGA